MSDIPTPPGRRLILASEDLLDHWGTRTETGAKISAEWGEQSAEGWYTPRLTVTDDGMRLVEKNFLSAEKIADALDTEIVAAIMGGPMESGEISRLSRYLSAHLMPFND
jgi:hypothetical protein